MSNDSDWASRVTQRMNDELGALNDAGELDRIEGLDTENDWVQSAAARISREIVERLETIEAERDELLRRFNR